jgi:hypothetical protein
MFARAARKLRLLQPDKLLDLLAANYVAPGVTRSTRGKTKRTPEAFREALARGGEARAVQTGFGSAGSYAVMAKEPMQYFRSPSAAGQLVQQRQDLIERCGVKSAQLQTSPLFMGFALLSQALDQFQRLGAGKLPGREFRLELRRDLALRVGKPNLHPRPFRERRAGHDETVFDDAPNGGGHAKYLLLQAERGASPPTRLSPPAGCWRMSPGRARK